MAGCVKFMPKEPSSISGQGEISIDYSAPSYSAGFYSEEPETKTYVGTDNKLYWNENDRVAVFAGTSENLQYVFTGKTHLGPCEIAASVNNNQMPSWTSGARTRIPVLPI